MEYIRSWKVGDRTFDNKTEALKAEARATLDSYGTVDQMIANADAVIAALRPFATPKRRKSAKNGQTDAPAAGATAHKGKQGAASQPSA